MRKEIIGAFVALTASLFGQSTALQLSSGSAGLGSSMVLNLSLNATSATPASAEFTLSYSTTDFSLISLSAGSATTASSKTLNCTSSAGRAVCVVWGDNSTTLQNGVIATVQLTVSTTTVDTTSTVLLSGASSVSTTGNAISTTASGASVAIVQPTLLSLSCTPTQVTPTAAPTCTASMTSAVPAATPITLSSNNAKLVVPATITVPALSATATFTPTTTAVTTSTSVQVTASYAGGAQTATVTLLPPCTYTLTPTTRLFTSGGGSTSVAVATGSTCSWTATTTAPTWITLQSGGVSGTGNGSFVYSVAANASSARLGPITVGNQSFEVMEEGSTSVQPFNDVLPTDPYFDYVSLMKSDGITAGCESSPPMYCPSTAVTRAQMSVFIVAALDLAQGTSLTYPPTQVFQDVAPSGTPDSIYFPFVQRIYQLGITAGCNTSPLEFCPDEGITQGQMAVFMITSWMQANNLSTFTYTTTPYFSDVPSTNIFFKFIQKMQDLGFWSGCGNGQYCPTAGVTRDQMAPMIMRAILGAP